MKYTAAFHELHLPPSQPPQVLMEFRHVWHAPIWSKFHVLNKSFVILIETNQNQDRMASNLKPAYAYTVVYVKDVAKSIAFYSNAFGYPVRRMDESHRWGELESGQTTIAFTPRHQHETDDLTGKVQKPSSGNERQPVEICFDYPDVDAAYKRAVENGAGKPCQRTPKTGLRFKFY